MGVGMWDLPDDTDYSLHKPFAVPDHTPVFIPGPRVGPPSSAMGKFPASYWNADFLALVTVAEFTRRRNDWRKIAVDPPPDGAETQREVDYLLDLAKTQRTDDRLKEIIAQHNGFLGFYTSFLMISPGSARQTYLLIKIACRVAELTMAFYKAKFNRTRPSQLCPALMPPVPVQGHPSYPSGHALTAHLITNCLGDVCSEATTRDLANLAQRIAKNREIAGFHYPSDSAAGKVIADGAHRLLSGCPSYRRVRNHAEAEWRDRV